ncbi:MAG: hypothetical protein HQ494_02820 [Rhodospirillales bacterium]|nr:hypothetical protein [Rhodospirillales bacterium]
MKLFHLGGSVSAAAIAFTAAIAAPAMAVSVKDTYNNRTVTILVGYGAGGTYGQTSLLLSRHLNKKIPGNPTLIVQHMPGAGGLKMTNYAYNVMPKNGLFVLMPPEMTAVSQLLRPKKVKYATNKFTWLGTVFGANQVFLVRRDTGIRSIADVTRKELIVASTGTGSPTFLVPKMMNGILGTRFKIVTGYKGSAKTILSMEQGETFGMTSSWISWTTQKADWIDRSPNSFAVILSQVGFTKEKELQDVPLLSELARNPDDKAAAAMLSTASVIGRGLAFPPGVPRSLVEPIRSAFWATVNDPVFKAYAGKRKIPVTPMKGAELQKIIADTMNSMSQSAIAKARKHIFAK